MHPSLGLKSLLVILFCWSALTLGWAGDGDLNGDSVVNVKDLVILTGHLNGDAALPEHLLDAADIDRNGRVEEDDRLRMVDLILSRDITPYIPQAAMEGGDLSFPSVVSAGESFNVSFGLTNTGGSVIDRNLVMRLWLSREDGENLPVGTYAFTGSLKPGESMTASRTIQAPLAEGEYRLVVEIDAAGSLGIEDDALRFVTADDPISVVVPFTAQISAREDAVPSGVPVFLSGSAVTRSGQPASFTSVAIRIRNPTFSRDIQVTTDGAGRFETEWTPSGEDVGTFEIGAAHPGAASFPVEDSVRVLNLEVVLESRSVRFPEGGSATISGTVRNPGDVPLGGFTVSAPDVPPGLDFSFAMPAGTSLPPGETKEFEITFNSLPGTDLEGTLRMDFQTAEGARRSDLVGIRVVPSAASLTVSSALPLYEGVVRGSSTTFAVAISNEGNAESGPVRVSLPNLSWLSLASVNPLPSIPPGGTAQVEFSLRPGDETPLTAFTGNLYIEPSSGSGVSLPYEFRVVSDRKGGLTVTVEDELTYFTPAKPNVAGATVKLRDPVTREPVATLVTPASGTATFPDLPEGPYYLEVSSPSHNKSEQLIEVKPGRMLPLTVFIMKNFVSYHWSVEPIEIRDQYRITIESDFETNVPAPVVLVSPASLDLEDLIEVGDAKQIDLTFTNFGLIDAVDNRFRFPSNSNYEFLATNMDIGTIPAMSSVTVPINVRRTGLADAPAGRQPRNQPPEDDETSTHRFSCHIIVFDYGYWCGSRYVTRTTIIPLSGADGCPGGAAPFVQDLVDLVSGYRYLFADPVQPGAYGYAAHNIGGWLHGWSGGYGFGGGGGVSAGYNQFSFSLPPPDCFTLDCPLGPLISCMPLVAPGVGWIKILAIGVSCVQAGFDSMLQIASRLLGEGEIPSLVPVVSGWVGCLGKPWMGCVASIIDCLDQQIRPRNGTGSVDRLFTNAEIQIIGTSDRALADSLRRMSDLESFPIYYYGDRRVYLEAFSPAARNWNNEFAHATDLGSSGGRDISDEEWNLLEATALADGLDWILLKQAVSRWQTTVDLRRQGFRNQAEVPAEVRDQFIAQDVLAERLIQARQSISDSQALGYSGPIEEFIDQAERVKNEVEGGTSGVCARVTMQINQTAVLTRMAFEANLNLSNNVDVPMEQVAFDLEILDADGSLANDRFFIEAGFVQGVETTGGGQVIPGGSTGSFRWTLIPREEAAPDGPRTYRIGGTISFFQGNDPYFIQVAPADITVQPDARLHLKYFHQRDVYSDDPHTAEIEPSQPFALAVLVENRGAGAARNLSITSAQPEIIDNELGLAIDFKILSTQVAGQAASPSLEADFGEIPAGESKVATWLLGSTLQGLFLDYRASFEHLDSRGDPRLSLIQGVEIHEMIRMSVAPDDGSPAFLVNDIPDIADLPDTVHRSDGSTMPLALISEINVTSDETNGSERIITIQAIPPAAGWTYLRVPDPAGGGFALESVSDSGGREILLGSNVWQTDRTFIGFGRRPRLENLLHLADLDGPGGYTLRYRAVPPPDLSPPSSALVIDGVRNGTDVILRWQGEDEGDGVALYDVYVSTNGGAFALWLRGTRETSAIFQGEPGASYSFYTVATDAAGNQEAPPAGGVSLPGPLLGNLPPVIEPLENMQVLEGSGLSFQVRAADPDGPLSALRYRVTSPEPGITIHPFNGWLSWSSREGDGGRIIPVTVEVSDGGQPRATASATFQIEVGYFNLPPRIPAIPARTIPVLQPFTQPVQVVDADLPPQEMTFRLIGVVPQGMAIDPASGLITWTPGGEAAGVNHPVTVEVTDAGSPPLSASRSFALHVLDTRELPPLAAVELADPLPGLTYAYYHGNWSAIPDFTARVPHKMGRTPAPDLGLRERSTRYGFVFAGYLLVPEDGYYTIFGTARDALRLWIGGELPLDLDSTRNAGAGFAPLRLAAGYHPVRIEFLRTSSPGAPFLTLEWEGPGRLRQAIPANAWFTTFETLRDPDAPLDSDLDGIPDDKEALFGFDPHNPDSNGNGVLDGLEDADNDGIPNALEIRYGLNPLIADPGGTDLDKDGLTFLQELEYGTDPTHWDTDGDGWNDETEISGGSDPTDPTSVPTTIVVAAQSASVSHLPLTRDLRNVQGDINQTGLYMPYLPTPADINPTGLGVNPGQPTVIIIPSQSP